MCKRGSRSAGGNASRHRVLSVMAVACALQICSGDSESGDGEGNQLGIGGIESDDNEGRQMGVDDPEHDNEEAYLKILTWGHDDPVDIFYAEFLLSRWVLDHAPWNAYHSAIAFTNNATGQQVLFDYCPDDTSSVMKMLVPEVSIASAWRTFLFGDAEVKWQNSAKTKLTEYRPEQYTTYIRIGGTNGFVVNVFSEWVMDQYAPNHLTFDPLEIILNNGSLMPSSMCHDFVTASLWELYRSGVRFHPDQPIFRDHIIVYAEAIENTVTSSERPSRLRRELLRYLRLLQFFRSRIAQQFTYGREALIVNFKMGLPIYMRARDIDVRVHNSPPFLNYCYLPLSMPPQRHSPLKGTKLCALAMEANLTNISVPLRSAIMSSEGRLDRDEVFGSVVMVAVVAVLSSSVRIRRNILQ